MRSTITNYFSVRNNDDMLMALKESMLSEEEKRSGKNLHIFYVSGKNARKVLCLLTEEMKNGNDCLVDSKTKIGI